MQNMSNKMQFDMQNMAYSMYNMHYMCKICKKNMQFDMQNMQAICRF